MLFGLTHNSNPRLQLLKNVVLFKDLSMRELAMVNSLLHERRYIADEVIFDEGEEAVRSLIDIFRGHTPDPLQKTLPCGLDVRGSTGLARKL